MLNKINNSKNKWIYLTIAILIAIEVLIVLYSIHINNYESYLSELIITLPNSKAISVGDINVDMDIFYPKWDSFFDRVSKTTYNFVGYSSSLILDLLQVSVLFLTGVGFINILIFYGSGEGKIGFNSIFWKLYIIAFVVYLIFIVYYVYKSMKENYGFSDNSTKLKKISRGATLVFASAIVSPIIFLIIDFIIYLALIIFFPFMFQLLFGLDIFDNNATLGKYTISTMLFNSSFKEQMGSYISVPTANDLFPGETFEFNIAIKLSNWDISIFDGHWVYTPNADRSSVVDSINFLLFYCSEFTVIVLVSIISVKLTKNSFKLFMLFVTSPLYFATISNEESKLMDWFEKMKKALIEIITITIMFILFTTTLPVIVTAIGNNDMDTFREVNWTGMVNIIIIISGLFFTIKADKNFSKEKKKSNGIEIISNEKNHNNTNKQESQDDFIFEFSLEKGVIYG